MKSRRGKIAAAVVVVVVWEVQKLVVEKVEVEKVGVVVEVVEYW